MLSTDSCKELKNEFGGFCLSCPTLSTYDHTLIFLSSLHEVVSIVSCGKNVGRFFSNLLVFVAIDVSLIVDGEELVRIDGHQNGTSQGLHRRGAKLESDHHVNRTGNTTFWYCRTAWLLHSYIDHLVPVSMK